MREYNRPCIFCNQGHWPSKCPQNLKERKAVIAELQRCTNCFGTRHENKDCTSTRNCNRCVDRHHTALCEKKRNKIRRSSRSRNIQIHSVRKRRNSHHRIRKHIRQHNVENRHSFRNRPGWSRDKNHPIR